MFTDINADQFRSVAQKQMSVGERGSLPCRFHDHRSPQFDKPLWCCLHDDQFSLHCGTPQFSIGGNRVSLTEPFFLPDAFAGQRIDAGELVIGPALPMLSNP